MSIASMMIYLSILHTTLATDSQEMLYKDCQYQKKSTEILYGCYDQLRNVIIISSTPAVPFDKAFSHEIAHALAYQRNVEQYIQAYGFKDEEEMADEFYQYKTDKNYEKNTLKSEFYNKYSYY